MPSRPTTDHLLALGEAVARRGVAANRPAVDALAAQARAAGVKPVLVDVLEDRDVPDAVHQRALGRLIVAMCAHRAGVDQRPCDPPPPPAHRRQLAAA